MVTTESYITGCINVGGKKSARRKYSVFDLHVGYTVTFLYMNYKGLVRGLLLKCYETQIIFQRVFIKKFRIKSAMFAHHRLHQTEIHILSPAYGYRESQSNTVSLFPLFWIITSYCKINQPPRIDTAKYCINFRSWSNSRYKVSEY
jgi:hypothetical protein